MELNIRGIDKACRISSYLVVVVGIGHEDKLMTMHFQLITYRIWSVDNIIALCLVQDDARGVLDAQRENIQEKDGAK